MAGRNFTQPHSNHCDPPCRGRSRVRATLSKELACLLVWSPTSYASSPALKIMLQDREGGKQVRKCYLNVMSLLLPVLLSQRVLACLQSRQPRFCRNRACRDTHPMQWATFQFWKEVSKLASSSHCLRGTSCQLPLFSSPMSIFPAFPLSPSPSIFIAHSILSRDAVLRSGGGRGHGRWSLATVCWCQIPNVTNIIPN